MADETSSTATTSDVNNDLKPQKLQGPKPTPGRIVHFFYAGKDDDPLAALVCGVNADTNVNLVVIDFYGMQHPRLNVEQGVSGDGRPFYWQYPAISK